MATQLPEPDAERRRRWSRGWQTLGWVGGTLALLDGLAVLLGGTWPPRPTHPAPTPIPRAPVASVSVATLPSTDAGSIQTPPAKTDGPPPTPRVLPASNAFTTLDDYRQRRASAPHSPEPLTPPPAGRTPETELGRVTLLVRDYRAAFGANPVGNNREIVRTLLGDNPRGTKFLDPATVSLNGRGELLDAWGHPYFFHALSGTAMEIRSAGPDGKAYTADDLVR